ncbi:MAG: hypothetical protein HKP41_01685 [Desulfobacterales bacterium]|nr:hypothetical protein [Desulfobacterales bacterium]
MSAIESADISARTRRLSHSPIVARIPFIYLLVFLVRLPSKSVESPG